MRLVGQFCQKYLAYGLNSQILDPEDQKTLSNKHNAIIVDPQDWVQKIELR